MSVEALTDGVYTTAGDVWSFGVVLWEVVTLAKLPYSIWTNPEVYEHVVDEEYRLPRPKTCPAELYALTTLCWYEDPTQRATFAELASKLSMIAPGMSTVPLTYVRKGSTVSSSSAEAEGGPGRPDLGEYDNADAGGGGDTHATHESDSDDSFEGEGLDFVDPTTLEPIAGYYNQGLGGRVAAVKRSPTKWKKPS